MVKTQELSDLVAAKHLNEVGIDDFSWDDHCFSLVKRYFPGEASHWKVRTLERVPLPPLQGIFVMALY